MPLNSSPQYPAKKSVRVLPATGGTTRGLLFQVSETFPAFWGLLCTLLVVTGFVFLRATPSGQAAEPGTVYLPVMVTPREFEITPGIGSFGPITDITHAGDDRLFVMEKRGVIFVIQPSGTISLFLDISDRVVDDGQEQGLLGLAFHPEYAQNGYFFVTYTAQLGAQWEVRTSRFHVSADPQVADPASELILLQIPQQGILHNGGGLAFNPLDGYLYQGVGDDSQFLVAQDAQSVLGKLLRLNVDSLVNANAPWQTRRYLDAQALVPVEIWAYGLRNPWRFAIDPVRGHIYIGDVGDRAWEEVDIIPGGAPGFNFGWPCLEGPEIMLAEGVCAEPWRFTLPVYYYPHGHGVGTGCAVIAGKVLRPETDGRFIFADSCRRSIFAMTYENGVPETVQLGTFDAVDLFLNTFGEDNKGNLYLGMYWIPDPGPLYELYVP